MQALVAHSAWRTRDREMPWPALGEDCGPLLRLDEIQQQLRLGAPVGEGVATIAVADIIGTVTRGQDFDACFQPLRATLRKRINEIEEASPPGLDEPIEVVRVDRAYFVADGHKRVSIARRTGREFIDARVSRVTTPYAFTPRVEEEVVERTAREGEFRRHSGLADAVPDARFPLSDVNAYGELLLAVQSYGFDMERVVGQMLSAVDTAKAWYEKKYLPTVARGREAINDLLESCTDADLFLALHRHERSLWGSVCTDPECIPDMLLADQRRTAGVKRLARRILGDDRTTDNSAAVLLPSARGDRRRDPA